MIYISFRGELIKNALNSVGGHGVKEAKAIHLFIASKMKREKALNMGSKESIHTAALPLWR